MPLVYFDSSALEKLLVEEAGSDLVADLWDGCDAALSSRLAYPELRAALLAAGRNHDLDDQDLTAAEEAWEEYWSATRPVELTGEVEHLSRHAPGPVVEVNRAVVHGRAFGADAGLAVLEEVHDDALGESSLVPRVRGDLL